MDSDSTWTASENDMDTNKEVNSQWSEAGEEFWLTPTQDPSLKRDIQESTEDESNVIRIETGSFLLSKGIKKNKK